MRILAVNWLDLENPQAGGAEVHFFEIFGRLARRGHEVTLIASGWKGASPRASISEIEVHRFGGRHSFALHGRGAVRRLIERHDFDVLVEDINKLPLFLPTLSRLPFYAIVPHLFGTTAFREAALPVAAVVWLAELPIPRVYRRAAFHAISESTREDLVRRGVPRQRIRVIFPGVDSQWFAPDEGTRRTTVPTFLYVGRLKRYKGIDTVLRAVAQLRGEGGEVRLQIAGKGDDLPRLERIARDLDLSAWVRFLGFVDEEEKRRLLRRAWAVVFPSVKEGWGIANVEAAACGTPAIASDSPGLRESVIDGTTGLLVPHGDVGAMANALGQLCRQPDLVSRLGQAGRRFAETLSWDQAADQTEAHMLEAVNGAH
ncbi:MAG: glycosyltransferase family 4 protein [Gemmatimonadota bacterium]|nr:MAG: glycosyltransferase family 4 protein [Gemmatimonadota bacterium]